jgi:thiol-disulfide isomerase/thioredoxin
MRRAALLLVVGALLGSAPARIHGQAPAGYEVGTVVPTNVAFKDVFGKDHTIGEYRGKVVFVHFWSIVCPYEKLAEPKCIALQKEYGDKLVEIAINANQGELKADGSGSYSNLRDHVQQAGVNFLVAVDPGNKLTDLFGGTNTPHCFVLDKDGTLKYSGALDDDPRGEKGAQATPYVRNAITAVLAGQPIATAKTKPYG